MFDERQNYRDRSKRDRMIYTTGIVLVISAIFALVIVPYIIYTQFRIDVPAYHFAVLTTKTGIDLENDEEVAPDADHKGLQLDVLNEGRYFYNPYSWSWEVYPMIEIPKDKMGVRIRLYGEDLPYGDFLAIDENHKGIVEEVLRPGRYSINAKVIDRRTKKEVGSTRGYKSDYVEIIELWEPKIIPAGYKGIRTNLAGPLPKGESPPTDEPNKPAIDPSTVAVDPNAATDEPSSVAIDPNAATDDPSTVAVDPNAATDDPSTVAVDPTATTDALSTIAVDMNSSPDGVNSLLVPEGCRGAQKTTLEPGTYYLNPYMYRINSIDTRSQRFNLSEGKIMTFPSKDGFLISLDGIIEFRVIPESAAQTYVTYNDVSNDLPGASAIAQEIIDKVIMPNARAICRLRGSNSSARDFIGGETRTAFQKEFSDRLTETCRKQGIEIVQALITKIKPPQAIAQPLRDREIAAQELKQYTQQILQQVEEAKLATEKALIDQKKQLIEAERTVVEAVTLSQEEQEVAIEAANRDKAVATEKLAAAKDEAEAIISRATAKAAVIGFENEADAAGWKKAVESMGGDGDAYARYVMYQKLAPGYQTIMTNTADSPLMDIFKTFTPEQRTNGSAAKTTAPPADITNGDAGDNTN